jgi:hypothetical protein
VLQTFRPVLAETFGYLGKKARPSVFFSFFGVIWNKEGHFFYVYVCKNAQLF